MESAINQKYIIENIVINAKNNNLNISDQKLVRISNKLLKAILSAPNNNNVDIHQYAITKITEYLTKSYKKPQEDCDQQQLLNSLTLVEETINFQNNPVQSQPTNDVQTNNLEILAANDTPITTNNQKIIKYFNSNPDVPIVDQNILDTNSNSEQAEDIDTILSQKELKKIGFLNQESVDLLKTEEKEENYLKKLYELFKQKEESAVDINKHLNISKRPYEYLILYEKDKTTIESGTINLTLLDTLKLQYDADVFLEFFSLQNIAGSTENAAEGFLLSFDNIKTPTYSNLAELHEKIFIPNESHGYSAKESILDYPVVTGTAAAGGAATITLPDGIGVSATDEKYNGYIITITGGTGIGQVKSIIDYVGGTRVVTVSSIFDPQPDNTSEFIISELPHQTSYSVKLKSNYIGEIEAGHYDSFIVTLKKILAQDISTINGTASNCLTIGLLFKYRY